MSNRSERRRRARGQRQPKPPAATGATVIGEGVVASTTGQPIQARPLATFPPKRPGRHRWGAFMSFTLGDLDRDVIRSDVQKFLDNENMTYIGVGCVDCEEPIGTAGEICPAGDEWQG